MQPLKISTQQRRPRHGTFEPLCLQIFLHATCIDREMDWNLFAITTKWPATYKGSTTKKCMTCQCTVESCRNNTTKILMDRRLLWPTWTELLCQMTTSSDLSRLSIGRTKRGHNSSDLPICTWWILVPISCFSVLSRQTWGSFIKMAVFLISNLCSLPSPDIC